MNRIDHLTLAFCANFALPRARELSNHLKAPRQGARCDPSGLSLEVGTRFETAHFDLQPFLLEEYPGCIDLMLGFDSEWQVIINTGVLVIQLNLCLILDHASQPTCSSGEFHLDQPERRRRASEAIEHEETNLLKRCATLAWVSEPY